MVGSRDSVCAAPTCHRSAEYLRLAKLPITINGDTSGWNRAGKGVLFIGDHRNGLEYFLLLAALGQEGRKDIKIIGKPYALSVRLAEALDMHHEGYILPVIPRTLVSNKLNIFNRDIWMRLFNANKLSTQKEAKAMNVTAMKNAASFLANGYAVGVFPTGGVKSATTSKWYRGVGEMIKLLPEEARERVVCISLHSIMWELVLSMLHKSHPFSGFSTGWRRNETGSVRLRKSNATARHGSYYGIGSNSTTLLLALYIS